MIDMALRGEVHNDVWSMLAKLRGDQFCVANIPHAPGCVSDRIATAPDSRDFPHKSEDRDLQCANRPHPSNSAQNSIQ